MRKIEMDVETLRSDLRNDEGEILAIYLDHLKKKTFGIGHLVLKTDPEYGLEVGAPVSQERCIEAFEDDIHSVFEDCDKFLPSFGDDEGRPNEFTLNVEGFYTHSEEVQLIVANMLFNMGLTKLSKFKKFQKALNNRDYAEAAVQMKDSKWYDQVTNRAERLCVRMRACA
jgi:lysozyme